MHLARVHPNAEAGRSVTMSASHKTLTCSAPACASLTATTSKVVSAADESLLQLVRGEMEILSLVQDP